jgi:G3E family GTPase
MQFTCVCCGLIQSFKAVRTTDLIPMITRTPVTVLTGFLGSGKTTLMNRLLTEQHGQRIAVIENEFGEIGIDHELVINADEEIFEMNNGCICCTVRGDLIRIMGNLMKRRNKFDHILIETTGLADPGPVVQTFFVDDEMKEQLVINAVVTLVDAKHIWQHIDEADEAKEQIAFADVILLNKCDLVPPAELDRLEARLKAMNGMAKIHRTTNADIPISKITEVGGFNLEHAIGVDPKFLEPEYPFEWGGIFHLTAPAEMKASVNPDPSMKVVFIPVTADNAEELARARELAVRQFSSMQVKEAASRDTVQTDGVLHELQLTEFEMQWPLEISANGFYAVFTEHYPEELDLRIHSGETEVQVGVAAAYKPDHEHDEEVSSVGIEVTADCDGKKLNTWLSNLLRDQGADIFRMKGVFAVKGNPNRTIFQGVHMLLDAQDGGPWGNRTRKNSLVFIGKNLDRESLNQSFRKCLA